MLPDDPGEVVDPLENLIVDGEGAAGRVAGRGQILLIAMLGTPQEFGSVTFNGTPISESTSSTPANCCPMMLEPLAKLKQER
jgi:hypothetical protein